MQLKSVELTLKNIISYKTPVLINTKEPNTLEEVLKHILFTE